MSLLARSPAGRAALLGVALAALPGCTREATAPPQAAAPAPPPPPATPWEAESPLRPLPGIPLGVQADFSRLKFQVTPEKVRLGRWLFFDTRLSSDNTVACASCHRPEHGFSEPTAHSTGVRHQEGGRKAPTFLNGAWPVYDVYFWDGRAGSLVEQAKGPIANPIEMASTHEQVVATVAGIPGYRRAFQAAFGDEKLDIDRVAEAIAAYESTRLSGNSRYDRYDGGAKGALPPLAQKGLDLFRGKAACVQCHIGWNFTDAQFHNVGIGWDPKRGKGDNGMADLGRARISGKPEDTGAFKTPTLRDVSKHAPYMHDGSLKTLREVVEHYSRGGNPNPWLSKKISKLGLTSEEIDALVAFLESLDGEGYADAAPKSFPQ